MNPAEVLAVELRLYADSSGTRTIVPMVFGQTQEAVAKKTAGIRLWDRGGLLDALQENVTAEQFDFAMQLLAWMEKGGRRLRFGSGQDGSASPDLKPQGIDFRPVCLGTIGRLCFQFGGWEVRPVFGPLEIAWN
jgi:hypothetical protein